MNPHFASLVVGLGQQALAALDGTLPPGAGGMSPADARKMAQALIDTLGVLQERLQGRLEPDEQRLLDELLTTARFRFVQSGRPGG